MSEHDHRPRVAAGRAAARLGIGTAWGVVVVALVVDAPWLGVWLVSITGVEGLGVPGLVVGVALAVAVSRYARRWIQRLRLRLMAGDAVTVSAAVHRVDCDLSDGRPPYRTFYTVWFSWIDAAGTPQMRDRQYGFFAAGRREFEVRVAPGTQIPIRYPAGRPHRFIADVPYSATMADQFL